MPADADPVVLCSAPHSYSYSFRVVQLVLPSEQYASLPPRASQAAAVHSGSACTVGGAECAVEAEQAVVPLAAAPACCDVGESATAGVLGGAGLGSGSPGAGSTGLGSNLARCSLGMSGSFGVTDLSASFQLLYQRLFDGAPSNSRTRHCLPLHRACIECGVRVRPASASASS